MWGVGNRRQMSFSSRFADLQVSSLCRKRFKWWDITIVIRLSDEGIRIPSLLLRAISLTPWNSLGRLSLTKFTIFQFSLNFLDQLSHFKLVFSDWILNKFQSFQSSDDTRVFLELKIWVDPWVREKIDHRFVILLTGGVSNIRQLKIVFFCDTQ